MSKLLVVNDGKRERELLLVEKLVVGRDPACDFSHDDALLSRRHAEFQSKRDEVTVRDLGSRNGIFVNGTRAAERALHPGDVVQIGPLRVRYVSDRATVSIIPDDLDSGSTKVITAEMVALEEPQTGMMRAEDLPLVVSDPIENLADEDSETRVFELPRVDASEHEATVVVPAPVRPGSGVQRAPVASGSASRPAERSRAPIEPRPTATIPTIVAPPQAPAVGSNGATLLSAQDQRTLSVFVFVQLAALASVVFVASAVPLIVWRGETFGSSTDGGALALLRWPAIPIVIALGATYLIASLVNRRVLDALMSARQDPSAREPQV